MKYINPKNILKKIKEFSPKALLEKILAYDYRTMAGQIKNFNYKSPNAYKKLFQDKVFQKRIILCVAIIIAFGMIKGCIFKPRKAPIPPRPVQTEVVIQKDVPIYVESFGTLFAIRDVDIKAQVTGKIKEVHFKEGDDVLVGEQLYTIDPSEYEAQVRKAQASLAQSLANLKLKTDTLERNRKLVEKDLISKQDFESLQTELVSAQASVDLDKASLDLSKINLDYCYIVSPTDGVTAKSQLDPGNIVTADNGPVLVNIKDINTLYLDFMLSEKELAEVRDAMGTGSLKVEFVPEGDKNSYDGELVFINNTVDNMTGTIYMRALVNNKYRKLWAGQFVTVRLILTIQKDAVLAPYAAVKIGQKGHYLFVITDENKADLRQIKVGIRQGDYIIVEEGVCSGEKVVTTGMLGLYPGVLVIDMASPIKKTGKSK